MSTTLRTTARLVSKASAHHLPIPVTAAAAAITSRTSFRAISSTHPTQSADHHQVIDPIMERLWQFSRNTSAAVASITNASNTTAQSVEGIKSEVQRVDDVLGDPIMEKLWDLRGETSS